MKTFHYLTAVLLLLAVSIAPVAAQSFRISSFTTDGGGGTSAGGMFTVRGTAGQPEAGTLSGGPFTVQGGFWAAPQPPAFTGIRLDRLGNGRVLVSWPLPESGYTLYHTTAFQDWTPLPGPFQVNSNHLSVIRSERSEFFQLVRP